MKTAMRAIIKKDFRSVANRRLFAAFHRSFDADHRIAVYFRHLSPPFCTDDPDITKLLSSLPEAKPAGKPGIYACQHDFKLYPSGIFPGDSWHDSLLSWRVPVHL